jgi:hypothetical protein
MRFIASLLAVGALAVGGTSLAMAGGSPAKPAAKHAKVAKQHAVRHAVALRKVAEAPGEAASTESDADAAAQAAACAKAGIDPNGPNVNYDDATGTCDNNG